MRSLDELGPQLVDWLPSQRWFQGKARSVAAAAVADTAWLSDDLVLVIAEVLYDDADPEQYLIPLVPGDEGPLASDGTRWRDALTDPASVRLLAESACLHRPVPTAHGAKVEGAPVTGVCPHSDLEVRPLGVEQSNTSAVLGDTFILKVLRRLEAGEHPDIELTAALTDAKFAHVPAQHGALLYTDGAEETALAVLADFAPHSREGWTVATAETSGRDQGLLEQLPALGEAVAGMHLVLAERLGTTAADPNQGARWAEEMHAQLDRVLGTAERRDPEATAEVRARADEITRLIDRLAETDDVGVLVRIHGDLHLGQVLLDSDGRWLLLDFEGEPVRPLSQRRAPGSPLRDVAGLLRSFDYAAAEPHGGQIPEQAAAWRDQASEQFLSGYMAKAAALLPAGETAKFLLAMWELDKAVYELGYELANRPSWVPIPAGGIVRLVDTLSS